MSYINANNMFSFASEQLNNSHRQFMLLEWKDILLINVKKFSKYYPELKNMDINDCAKQIEEIIYNKCVYKNNSNLSFYFFCQVYLYIYLTDIFKDVFIEKFTVHIYNCYVNDNMGNMVHCHDYILKNIVEYDCSIESELIKYINLINQNVKKLSEIMFNKYQKWLKNYSEGSVPDPVKGTKTHSESSKKTIEKVLSPFTFDSSKPKGQSFVTQSSKNKNLPEKGTFDNIIDSVKNIFSFSDNSQNRPNDSSSHIVKSEKIQKTNYDQPSVIIKSSVNCVDKKYLDEMEERLTKLITNTYNNNIENLNKLLKQWDTFSNNIIKIVNDIKVKPLNESSNKYIIDELNKVKSMFTEYNKNINNTINTLNKKIDEKLNPQFLYKLKSNDQLSLKLFEENKNNNKIIIDSLNTIQKNNKIIFDMLNKYQNDLQNQKLVQPIIKLPENIQNITDDNFKKLILEYNKVFSDKLNDFSKNLSDLNTSLLSQTKQFSDDHNKNNIIHSEINSKISTLNDYINNLNQSIQNTKTQLPSSQSLTISDDVKKQFIEILTELNNLKNQIKNLEITSLKKDSGSQSGIINKNCDEYKVILDEISILKKSIADLYKNKPPEVKLPENISTVLDEIKFLNENLKQGTTLMPKPQYPKIETSPKKQYIETKQEPEANISVISSETTPKTKETVIKKNVSELDQAPVEQVLKSYGDIKKIEARINNISQLIEKGDYSNIDNKSISDIENDIKNLKDVDKDSLINLRKKLENDKNILNTKLKNIILTQEQELKELNKKKYFLSKLNIPPLKNQCGNLDYFLENPKIKQSSETKNKNIINFKQYIKDISDKIYGSNIDECKSIYFNILEDYIKPKHKKDEEEKENENIENMISDEEKENIKKEIIEEIERIKNVHKQGGTSSQKQNIDRSSKTTLITPPTSPVTPAEDTATTSTVTPAEDTATTSTVTPPTSLVTPAEDTATTSTVTPPTSTSTVTPPTSTPPTSTPAVTPPTSPVTPAEDTATTSTVTPAEDTATTSPVTPPTSPVTPPTSPVTPATPPVTPEQNFIELAINEIENSLNVDDQKYFINKINTIILSTKKNELNDCETSKNSSEEIKNICIENIKKGSQNYIDIISKIIDTIKISLKNTNDITIKNNLNNILSKLEIIKKNLDKNKTKYNESIKPVELKLDNNELDFINEYINNMNINLNYNTNQTFKNIVKYILTGIFVEVTIKDQLEELKEDLNTKFSSIVNNDILNFYISLNHILGNFYLELIDLLQNQNTLENENLLNYLNNNKQEIQERNNTIINLLDVYINNNKNSIKNFISEIENYNIQNLIDENVTENVTDISKISEDYNTLPEEDKKTYMKKFLINKVQLFPKK